MKNPEIKNRVLSIVNRLAPLTPKAPVDKGFVFSGDERAIAMDSVVALQLVLAIEEEFGVTVEDTDIRPENFGDLMSLCHFVETKLARS
jgi:acyl carrier protein